MKQHYDYPQQYYKPEKLRISKRNSTSEFDMNFREQKIKRSRVINGDRLKLVEVDSPLTELWRRQRTKPDIAYWSQPKKEIYQLKADVLRLKSQILTQKSKSKKNEVYQFIPSSRFRNGTLSYNHELLRNSHKIGYKPFQNQREIWQYSHQLRKTIRKKLYKIQKRNRMLFLNTNDQDQNFRHQFFTPVSLNKSRKGQRQRQQFDHLNLYKVRHPITFKRLFRNSRKKIIFRKIVNVILFMIRLKAYNQRMRIRRFDIFKQYVGRELNHALIQLKKELTYYSKPLFIELNDQQNFNLRLRQSDEVIQKRQKVKSACKLVRLQVKYIEKCANQLTKRLAFRQLLYILCKHGNYTSAEQLNTAEELGLACVSQNYGYLRADKYLQKSAIVSLVFIKILLFNILLQPEEINLPFRNKTNLQVVFSNLKLIGNILYELFIDIQDELLQRSPAVYKIGNWVSLQNTYKIKVAQSMTVKKQFFQKNELISGLASHMYIKDVYETRSMINQRQTLKVALNKLHQSIVDYHRKFRKQSFGS